MKCKDCENWNNINGKCYKVKTFSAHPEDEACSRFIEKTIESVEVVREKANRAINEAYHRGINKGRADAEAEQKVKCDTCEYKKGIDK